MVLATNKHKGTCYQKFMNINERTLPLFMFVQLTKRTKILVRVHLLLKRTQTNFPQTIHERFTEH
ncbi:hypothetical protein Hanom_Chr05g00468851 [Helianthus anomalus]